MTDSATDRTVALGQLQIAALEASSRVRLEALEGELVQAQAASDWETAKGKQIAVQAFKQAMADLQARKHLIEAQCDAIARRATYLSFAKRGEHCGASVVRNLWNAYRACRPPAAVLEAIAAMTIAADDRKTRAGQNFADVRSTHQGTLCARIPDDVRNVLQMVDWLSAKWFVMPRVGTQPYLRMCRAFEMLGGDPDAEISKWQNVLALAQQGIYTIFDPVKFASLPPDPAVAALTGRSAA